MAMKLEIQDYTYFERKNGRAEVSLDNIPWIDVTHNRFVRTMAAEIAKTREKLAQTEAQRDHAETQRDESLKDVSRESFNVKYLTAQLEKANALIENLESALTEIEKTPIRADVDAQKLKQVASNALSKVKEPCIYCNGKGVSAISDPCICKYEPT